MMNARRTRKGADIRGKPRLTNLIVMSDKEVPPKRAFVASDRRIYAFRSFSLSKGMAFTNAFAAVSASPSFVMNTCQNTITTCTRGKNA